MWTAPISVCSVLRHVLPPTITSLLPMWLNGYTAGLNCSILSLPFLYVIPLLVSVVSWLKQEDLGKVRIQEMEKQRSPQKIHLYSHCIIFVAEFIWGHEVFSCNVKEIVEHGYVHSNIMWVTSGFGCHINIWAISLGFLHSLHLESIWSYWDAANLHHTMCVKPSTCNHLIISYVFS